MGTDEIYLSNKINERTIFFEHVILSDHRERRISITMRETLTALRSAQVSVVARVRYSVRVT